MGDGASGMQAGGDGGNDSSGSHADAQSVLRGASGAGVGDEGPGSGAADTSGGGGGSALAGSALSSGGAGVALHAAHVAAVAAVLDAAGEAAGGALGGGDDAGGDDAGGALDGAHDDAGTLDGTHNEAGGTLDGAAAADEDDATPADDDDGQPRYDESLPDGGTVRRRRRSVLEGDELPEAQKDEATCQVRALRCCGVCEEGARVCEHEEVASLPSHRIKSGYIILTEMEDVNLIEDFQKWRSEQRLRDAALRLSASRRLERERERYHRNRDARLAYAKEYYRCKKEAAAKNVKN